MTLVRSTFRMVFGCGLLCVGLTACSDSGGFGDDWLYSRSADPITLKTVTSALLILPSDDYTNQPSYLAATCSDAGFELFVASEGFWGQASSFFGRNQTFEMRIGGRIFSGRYLPSASGDSAYLISRNPNFKAVEPRDLLAAFADAKSIAVRVSDYRGVSSTTSTPISGSSKGLAKVAADCGIK